MRARGKPIFNRFCPDVNLQKKDEHFEQMTFPQKRSWKITTLSWNIHTIDLLLRKSTPMETTQQRWGFLRETQKKAELAGIDPNTGLHRTGLERYLSVIFPNHTWIHDRAFGTQDDGASYRIRPDYRCEELRLIVEFDGLLHYQRPETVKKDLENQAIYEKYGYKVIRIPYFIQLTQAVVKELFGVEVNEPLFSPDIPSMSAQDKNTPAYCCPAGLKRMAEELKRFPQQMAVNVEALQNEDDHLTGLSILEMFLK